jgi:hypothetical protein
VLTADISIPLSNGGSVWGGRDDSRGNGSERREREWPGGRTPGCAEQGRVQRRGLRVLRRTRSGFPGRRDFCRGSVAAAALGLLSASSVTRGAADAPLDLAKPGDLLRAFVKMRNTLGPELCIGWLRGQRFAISEGRVQPLCGMLAATFNVLNRVSDDEIEFISLEVSFYTDFETGEPITELVMPFTGKTVQVPVHRFGPTGMRFAISLDETEHFVPKADTNQAAFATAGSVSMSKSIEVDAQRDGDLVLRHEEYGRRYPEGTDKPSMFYRESTLWTAPLDEVVDPRQQRVDSTRVAYSAMTSWRPWMEVGDLPGHTFSNGFGRRARSVEELPADYRDYVQQVHPDVLADPEGLLRASQSPA